MTGLPLTGLQTKLETTCGLYLLLSPDLEVVAVSAPYLEAVTPFTVVERPLLDVLAAHPGVPGAAGALRGSLEAALRTKRPVVLPVETHLVESPGGALEERHWSSSSSPVLGPSGELLFLVHCGTDVTEQVRAGRLAETSTGVAQALVDAERRLALTLEASEVGTWLWDVQADRVTADQNLARLFGLSPGEAAGGPLAAYVRAIHPDDRPSVQERIAAALGGADSFEAECRVVRAGGDIRWVLARGRVERGPDGEAVGLPGVTLDITDRVRADEERRALTAKVEQQDRVFDITLSAIADFAYVFNKQGQFIYVNKALLDLWGLTLSEAMYKDFFQLHYPEDLAAKLQHQVQHVFETGEVITDETAYTSPTGVDGYYEYIFTPVYGATGTVEVVAGSTRVMTARKAVELERERLLAQQAELQAKSEQLLGAERAARIQAERIAQAKDEFLATLSHELRTPLNAILGWSQLLRRRDLDPARMDDGLATIERNAYVQKHMIEDLLDMSGIMAGKVRLNIQSVSLAELIENAVAAVQPSADAKQIAVSMVLGSMSAPVSVDPGRIQQVIWNLLTNAIKFTPKHGRIAIVLTSAGDHVQVSVRDTGEGMKAEFLPYVFDRFRQSDASTTRQHGGLGIGMAIVKTLVELHGGEVFAESDGEGKGATFTVRLPSTGTATVGYAAARRQALVPPVFDCSDDLLAGVKVLVVDDEADSRLLAARILEECGGEVQLAGSAEEALRLFESFAPHVVLSDIGMPGADGYELVKAIRALGDKGRTVPAAALTALARPEDRTRALLAGYQAHVAKPLEPNELVGTVAALAQRTGPPRDK